MKLSSLFKDKAYAFPSSIDHEKEREFAIKVLDLLLHILDEGYVTDNLNREESFTAYNKKLTPFFKGVSCL